MTRLIRVAARDGIEHANRPGNSRTLCGARALDQRYSWPRTTRCPVCLAAAEELLHARRDAKREGLPIG